MSGVQVPIYCPKCGSDRLDSPRSEPHPNDRLACLECGFQVTAGEATQAVADQLGEAIKKMKI